MRTLLLFSTKGNISCHSFLIKCELKFPGFDEMKEAPLSVKFHRLQKLQLLEFFMSYHFINTSPLECFFPCFAQPGSAHAGKVTIMQCSALQRGG